MKLSGNTTPNNTIRNPAVAGRFYSSEPDDLRSEIQSLIPLHNNRFPRLVISPHAGYMFSGSVAAKVLGMLSQTITTVFLIGPSHHVWFEGIAVSDKEYYATPLGTIPVALDVIHNLKKNNLVTIYNKAEEPEHCIEVQLPILQVVLPAFSIVPILTGNCAPADVAALLLPLLTDSSVVIASSDLSHYHPYQQAREIDDKSITTVLSGNALGFLDACGETSIRCIMTLANELMLKPELIEYKNSYDTAPRYCSDNEVVGYAAVGYF
jgi:AmmeMemoRadiSam system protein B